MMTKNELEVRMAVMQEYIETWTGELERAKDGMSIEKSEAYLMNRIDWIMKHLKSADAFMEDTRRLLRNVG